MKIGEFKHHIDVAIEFMHLAKEDEEAASILEQSKKYRQATYFLIQAMEKHVRAKIFTLVNPNLEYFRERNRTHSLEDAISFLIEIIAKNNPIIEQQIKNQLHKHVIGDTAYNHLHNNVRYPVFFRKHNSYSILNVNLEDYSILKERFCSLKKFLNDLHQLT